MEVLTPDAAYLPIGPGVNDIVSDGLITDRNASCDPSGGGFDQRYALVTGAMAIVYVSGLIYISAAISKQAAGFVLHNSFLFQTSGQVSHVIWKPFVKDGLVGARAGIEKWFMRYVDYAEESNPIAMGLYLRGFLDTED